MATRCMRCGGRNGCTDMECAPAPAVEPAEDEFIETAPAVYCCPVCTQAVEHYNAEWIAGNPMHPLCKLAFESEYGAAEPAGPKSPAVQEPPEETALVRPIILTLNFTLPVLLTPDNAVAELRAGVEDFLAGVILAYRQGAIKYNFKTAELDMTGVKRLVEAMTQENMKAVQAKMKETLSDTENRSK